MNKKRMSVLLIICSTLVVSGCISQSPEDSPQDSPSDLTQHPEITLEGEVQSITDDNQAVNEYTNTTHPVYVHLATVKITNLTVRNPDNAWLPSDLSEGNNITLLFERSTEPAQIVYSNTDQQTNTTSNHSTQSVSSNSSEGSIEQHRLQRSSSMKSVEKSGGQWVFTISNTSETNNETATLPGLDRGDKFRAELTYDESLSVTTYEMIS